ncbi:predicted protein [Naegleria gruberi]|uniref:Predicted protein n=1 Tax=Naegleria gruberi TaxID=5762 RepID=D2VQ53_NAEGR|nr:uncharacterized protein NAEGRDRAFT_80797 [Naegleria gruberi]EFC41044.1 predicted protein [Naegleria gruberi]|eukprot:XP_002673788.1 predicted protein [Naegleria gruberi strain NEG-M]
MNNCSRNQLTSKSSSFMNSNHRRVQFFNGVTKRRRPKALSSSASCPSNGSQKQRRHSRPHIDCLQILDLSLNKQVLYIVPHAPSTPLRSNSCSTPTSLNNVVNFNSSNSNTTTPTTTTITASTSTAATTTTIASPAITAITTIASTSTPTNNSFSPTISNESSITSFNNRPAAAQQQDISTYNLNESSPINFNSVVIHGSLYQSDTMAPLNSNEFIIDNYNRIDPKPELNSRLSDQSSTISSNSQLDSPLSDITEWNLDMSGSMFDILFIETDF